MTNPFGTRAPAISLVAALLLSACEPVETTAPAPETPSPAAATTPETQSTTVSQSDLETAAGLLANAFDSSKGEYTGAFRREGARAVGSTVVIESRITRTYSYVEPNRARRQLRALICEDEFTMSFVEAGGAFRFIFLSRSGGGSGKSVTISSC